MSSLSYLHDQHKSSDIDAIFKQSSDAYAVERDTTLGGYQKYLEHIANDGKLSLFEGLEALGVDTDVSSGGYPALRVGDATLRTNLCLNTYSGINAVLRMSANKYNPEYLTPNAHLAWYDPRTRAPGVLTVWEDPIWVVYDWRNSAYLPSKTIVPTPEGKKNKTNDEKRYYFQSELHQQIKEYLTSKDFGTSFLIVMNHDAELTHYQTKVADRREKDLETVWLEMANDWKESSTKSKIVNGKPAPQSSVKLSEAREEFITKLNKLSTDYDVVYDSGTGNESTLLFEAGKPEAKAKFLNGVRQAGPNVEFLRYEKAPTKE